MFKTGSNTPVESEFTNVMGNTVFRQANNAGWTVNISTQRLKVLGCGSTATTTMSPPVGTACSGATTAITGILHLVPSLVTNN